MDNSALEKVEAKRKELEDSVACLRKSLRHWQTLELDYEGLREEFVLLNDNESEDKCLEVARDFKPEALDDKDLQSLMKDAFKHPTKRPQQLAHTLSKRVDYVARNVQTIRKQFEGEQKKLNAILLAEDPETRDDAGLPLGEITEELDDSGQVISGNVEHGGGKAAGLAEVLQKAGVEGLKEENGTVTASKQPSAEAPVAPTPATHERAEPSWKQDTATEPSTPSVRPEGDRENDSDDDSDTSSVESILTNPTDTAEEARLRQEMVNYNLDTMNVIVAELDLAEGASDVSYDEDSDNPNLIPDFDMDLNSDLDEDLEGEDENSDSEDDKGAAKHLNLSGAYQRQMQELQEKLGLKKMQNLGPDASLPDDVTREIDRLNTPRPSAAEAARKAAIKRAEEIEKDPITGADLEQSKPKPRKAAKKKVVFSDSLDIAEGKHAPSPTASLTSRPKDKTKEANPVNETILEHTSSPTTTRTTPPNPSILKPSSKPKLSRFKAQISAAPPKPTSPTPPTDRLIASSVLERATPSSSAPPDPNGIDDEMRQKQMALEYHRLKNRQIHHQQGGYVKQHGLVDDRREEVVADDDDGFDEGDDNDWYTKDEETGTVRKLSKFKAARLR